jgi:hypothetical protein
MKPLAQHCHLLASSLFNIEGQQTRWLATSDFLGIAAGIQSVTVDISQFDSGFGYCSGADDYSYRNDKLWSELVRELARFQFAWAALEAFIDELQPPKPPNCDGKINRACYFLRTKYEPRLAVPRYSDVLARFRQLAMASTAGAGLDVFFAIQDHTCPSAVGLYSIYRLRNRFAHGSMERPNPPEKGEHAPDISMVEMATRLVLLSIQMLVIAEYPADTSVEVHWQDALDEDEEQPIGVVFRNIHLDSIFEPDQEKLI